MNKEHLKGAAKETQGKVKEAAGKATGDASLKAKGKLDQAEGKGRKGLGDVKDAARKAGGKR